MFLNENIKTTSTPHLLHTYTNHKHKHTQTYKQTPSNNHSRRSLHTKAKNKDKQTAINVTLAMTHEDLPLCNYERHRPGRRTRPTETHYRGVWPAEDLCPTITTDRRSNSSPSPSEHNELHEPSVIYLHG